MIFPVSAALSSSDKSMNDMGEGAGDAGGVLSLRDNRSRTGLLERKDLWSWRSRMLSSSLEPHIVETDIGDSGVECLRPLIFRYNVSSGGGQMPLSLGCSGFEIEAMTRWPFRTSGTRRDCWSGELITGLSEARSGPGVWPNSCVSLRVFLTNSARSAGDKMVVGGSSTLGLPSTDRRSE